MPRIFSEPKIILPRDTAQKKSRGARAVDSHVSTCLVTSTDSHLPALKKGTGMGIVPLPYIYTIANECN
jgi:hypothetical protein